MTPHVTEVSCLRMQMMHDSGLSWGEAADRIGRDPATVRRHAQRACRHYIDVASDSDAFEADEIVAAVCELAETLEPPRIPAENDWSAWRDRPCTAHCAKNVIGGEWTAVLQAAGFPPVHSIAPQEFRRLAYGLDGEEWQPLDQRRSR